MATKNVIKKIIKDGVEYFIYSTKGEVEVDSALSDTSENPVQNKVVKTAIDGKITNPSGGTTGQVLTKTQSGADWEDAQGGLPEGGTEGQFIRKTATGSEWVDGELVEITEVPDDYSAMQGPAPEGFHVPLKTEWQAVYDAYTGLGLSGTTNSSTYLKIPMAGYRSDIIRDRDSIGYYWSASPYDYDVEFAHVIYFSSSSSVIVPQHILGRSFGIPVRCFKDSPVIPTSSWRKLYGTSIESGGIFHNATDGLISISSDGTTWYTLMDKNLGATTVYNYGDTLTQANIGNLYQWGNNYGFPSTGTITNTSSTQVDVTGYGPGNYYESSTWITPNPRQSSANDGNNLRGGVTGIVKVYDEFTAGGKELAGKEYVDDMLGDVETLLANI